MKAKIIILAVFIIISISSFGQSPEFFKYQAVARQTDGSILPNTSVAFRMSILQGSSTGTVVYSERHTVTTNQFGLVNLSIGNGSLLSGSFSTIDWSTGIYFIKTEMDPAGGIAYQNLGTSQLLSIPFALYATKSGNGDRWLATGNDLYSGNSGNIGIGLSNPTYKLHVANIGAASSAKIGYSQLYFDNRLYFGDGDYVYIGERFADDRLYLRGGSLSIDLGGNLGINGQVLTSNGTTADWQNLPTITNLWNTIGQNIYNSNTGNVGVGTASPNSKLEVKATTSGLTDTLFQVKDYQGNTVFAVFPDGARLYVKEGARAAVGGFAVSGRSSNRTVTGDYLLVTPDSTRVYVKEGARAAVGGFAVSGRSSNRPTTTTSFMQITPDNYFIGQESGFSLTSGFYNSFLGYKAGYSTTTGWNNVFLGRQSGYSNSGGQENIFIGNNSGYSNTSGNGNIFIGPSSGYNSLTGNFNVFLGSNTGFENTTGFENVYIGFYAGNKNKIGAGNVYIGSFSGLNDSTGIFNTFVGMHSGMDAKVGTNNTFLGYSSGQGSIEGFNNTYLGSLCGLSNNGNANVMVGYQAGMFTTTGHGNVFVGNQAGRSINDNNKLYIHNGPSATPLIYGDFSAMRLGIGVNDPSVSLDVVGNARFRNVLLGAYSSDLNLTADGTLTRSASDKRLKTNINDMGEMLNKVMKLRPTTYNWKADATGRIDFGLIAQETIDILPEIVFQNQTDNYYGINYSRLPVVLIKAMQEQQLQIETLKNQNKQLVDKISEIETIKKENEILKAEVEKIKIMLGSQANNK